jgi:predicted GNAT family acetyltransferase
MTAPLLDGYEFSADPDRLDAARVHALLAEHAYWARGRDRERQDAAIAGSRNYGMFHRATGAQVAYARLVTDAATFAWLADVIVDPKHRGRGLGSALVTGIVADVEPLGLKRIVLKASAEGRAIYERLGFEALEGTAEWMQRASTPATSRH